MCCLKFALSKSKILKKMSFLKSHFIAIPKISNPINGYVSHITYSFVIYKILTMEYLLVNKK